MQQRVTFKNRAGHQLSGVLHSPSGTNTLAYALFAHCFTCTKNIRSAVYISESLAQQGIATLRFDFTGLGASQGDFSDSSFTTNINDLLDAAEYLKQEHTAPQLLVGHSLGGTAILAAASEIPSAQAVASIGSPAHPEHILHLIESELASIERDGQVDVDLSGRKFTFKQDFVGDLHRHEIKYKTLNRALMVLHSPRDDTVSVNEASTIFSSAMHPKSFVSLDTADHLLSNKSDAIYAGQVISAWARRYLSPLNVDEHETAHGVTVNAKTSEGFLCDINASGHRLIADEPTSMGGTNLGPSPYDYLSAALGTCTAMTLNMYARHKKLALNEVKVAVEHERIHADDCVDCEKQDGHIDLFQRTISIEGKLDDAQRTRLLQIADRCPVHRTLENEIKIKTKLAD